MEELYKRIKTAREHAKMGVNDAADRLGVKRVQVWRLENEAKTISAKRLFELADMYGVDPRKLFEGDDAPTHANSAFKRIEETVEFVEQQVQNLGSRPQASLVSQAVMAILRQELDPSFTVKELQFMPEKYTDLVKLIFTAKNTTENTK